MNQVLSPVSISDYLLEATPDPDELKSFALRSADTSAGGLSLEGLPVGNEYQRMANRVAEARRGVIKVDRNTLMLKEGDTIVLRLYQTNILTWFPDNSVVIDTEGYQSKSSLDRLWQFLPIGGWNILGKWPRGEDRKAGPYYQRGPYTFNITVGNWFWYNRAMDKQRENPKYYRDQPFTDGDKIDSDGTLHPQAQPIFRRRGKYLVTPEPGQAGNPDAI